MNFKCNLTGAKYSFKEMNLLELRNTLMTQENLSELDILAGTEEGSDMNLYKEFNIKNNTALPNIDWKSILLDVIHEEDIKITSEFYNKKYDIKKSIREKKAEKCKFLYERFNVEEENLPRINTIGHLRDNLGKPPSREEVSFLRKINKDIEDLEYELRKLGLFIPTLTVSKKQLDSISNELSKNSKFKYRISETGSDFIDLNKVLNSFNFREFAKIKRQTKKSSLMSLFFILLLLFS